MPTFFAKTKRLTQFATACAGATLACSTIVFAALQSNRLAAGLWVSHTLEVLVQIEQAKNDLYEILLTQKDAALLTSDSQVVNNKFKRFILDLNRLKQSIADNPIQVSYLTTINTSQSPTANQIRQIQAILDKMAQTEQSLLRDRSKRRDDANNLLSVASILTGVSFLGALVVVNHMKQRELEKEKQQIRRIADLIHDIRNPVTRLSLDVQLLDREAKLPVVTSRVQKILAICDFIIELLEDVRFLSYQKIIPTITQVNVKEFGEELTNKANSVHASSVTGGRVTFEFLSFCNTENFLFDAALIQRVLFNLLSNAIAYSPEDSPVHFSATLHEDFLLFTVADRGIGIPVRDRATLFEPFKRGGNVGSKQGTGLGLAISHQIIKACGGKIWFETRSPELGTKFLIRLDKKHGT